jgi:large subunit ribosomal protein L34e
VATIDRERLLLLFLCCTKIKWRDKKMPAGKHKSGRYRKIFVKAPGGKTKVQFRERKPSKAVCGSCKKQLSGVPRERPAVLGKLPKTQRRPERPFGGVLCSKCMRAVLKEEVREVSQ